MTETFTQRASRSLVMLDDPQDLAGATAAVLRKAAFILKDARPTRDRHGAMRWRSLARASVRMHHDTKRDRMLLEASMGITMTPSVIVQMRSPVLKSGRCSVPGGEIVDLLTCAVILLEGGAGPLDEPTRTCFSIVEDICSAEPDRPHSLPMLHSGNPFEDIYLWDEGMNGRRVMKVSPATARAMSLLPLITAVDVIRRDRQAIFVTMHNHYAGYGNGPASPLEVMRLHADLAKAAG